jgi:hypothetical protein
MDEAESTARPVANIGKLVEMLPTAANQCVVFKALTPRNKFGPGAESEQA